MSMKNSIDLIGNRTRDLPDRSAVPQPTACRRIRKLLDAGFESEKKNLWRLGYEETALWSMCTAFWEWKFTIFDSCKDFILFETAKGLSPSETVLWERWKLSIGYVNFVFYVGALIL